MLSSLAILLTATARVAVALDLESLRLKTSSTYVKSAELDLTPRHLRFQKRDTYLDTAIEAAKRIAPGATFRVSDDHYVGTNGLKHVYFHQTVHGIDIDNAVLNINIDTKGEVLSYGTSFFDGELPENSPEGRMDALLAPIDALDIVRSTLELPIDIKSDVGVEAIADVNESFTIKNVSGADAEPLATLVYVVKPDGDLALTWKIKTDVRGTLFSSYVSADSDESEVVGVVDHIDPFAYEVYPFPLNDPREGERKIVQDPQDDTASPLGWHDPPFDGTSFETWGNNVRAYAAWNGSLLYPKNPNGTFSFPYEPDVGHPFDYWAAAVTNGWYVLNMLHDLYYVLGFTPAAGNYQYDTNGEGGLGFDPVTLSVITWGEMNNGRFSQQVDGSSSTLTMLLFDFTDPWRDGSYDNGFLIHEYTHGLSDRLTGGPGTAGCLNDWEPDGMAEGWSDFFSAALTIKPDEDRDSAAYGFASWVTNNTNPPTARLRMYSTNTTINEFTYSSANGMQRVHQVGTVWATMLYEVLWNLIDKYGKNDGPRPDMVDGVPTDGKFLALKLVTDAFAIQPCNPRMVSARDAIIEADIALTGGENLCEIWSGFAKRGLGVGAVAADVRVDNFDMPDDVC